MRQIFQSHWFRSTFYLTIAATALTFVPFSPVAVVGGLALWTILPGMQLVRWLDLQPSRWNLSTTALSVALGLVTTPILIYWLSLVLGFQRWTVLAALPLYIMMMAALVSDVTPGTVPSPGPLERLSFRTRLIVALLICVTAFGVFLSYFELNTPQGYYPVQMEDWQKHFGVVFALRHTGVPPTSMFFYGMFPDEPLVYYYFLHLSGAALDLLQNGGPFLHNAFVTVIVLASLCFSAIFFLLTQTLLRSTTAAVWSLAFATVIGGLDVIPIVHRTLQEYRQHFPEGPIPPEIFLPREHIDNWVSALSLRLNTFYAHHVWVPQHLTALTILCLGCYLYLEVKERRKLLIVLPLLLFSLLGHSTWIAVIVAASLLLFGLWQILTIYRRRGFVEARQLFLGYALIAVIFVAVAAPFIAGLTGPNAPRSGIAFAVPTLDSWWILRPFQAAFDAALWARLLDLPLHFFIEMGALLVAGLGGLILIGRQPTVNRQSPIANRQSPVVNRQSSLLPFFILLLTLGFLIVSFFASGRAWAELGLTLNNDLGLRAIMPGQLVLALFAGYFLARLASLRLSRWQRGLLVSGLALLIGLGLGYFVWEFTAMGLAKYWTKPQLSADVYQTLHAMPEVTQPLDKPFPVVQHRQHRDASRFQLSLGSRPVAFSTGEAIVFHGEPRDLALAHELSRQAFDNGLPLWSYQMFQNLGANYLFVGPAEREAMRHPEKYEHEQYFEQVYDQTGFEIYQVQPAPYDSDRPLARFDDGAIEYFGYFIDDAPTFPEGLASEAEAYGFVTAWRLSQATNKNYTVFVHLVDAEGDIVAQADHQLWAWDVSSEGPTSIWTPELVHLDITPIPEAALTAEEALTIRLGLWLPDTGEQFVVETQSLAVDPYGRLIAGNLSR